LIGASRKRFVREIAGEAPSTIQAANAAIHALALMGGASIIRVHDAAESVAVVKMTTAVMRG
jgi:dihydropteroate synthase